jgi:spore coat protein U-like protein
MFVLLFTGSVGLWAFGQVELQDVPGTITGTYDYNTELVVSEQLTVVNGGTDPVNYYVTFGAGSSGDVSNRTLTDGSGNTLSYQFMDSATTRNVLKNNASARTTDDVLAGSLAGSAQESRSFDVVVFSGQFPPAGQYTDSLVITAYSGTVGSGQFSTFGFTTVDVTVPSVVELSLVDTGAPFDPTQSNYIVDFGVLSAGATRQLDMLVRSNETFGVSIESQNAGVMAIQTAGDSSTVPYQLSVNGSAVDLSSGNPVSVLSSVGPTVLAGQRYPISVEIQDYGFATDGIYQDNLTITVTAQ